MSRRTALWVLGVLGFALGAVLVGLDLRMQSAGGWGIIDFELAGTQERAREILTDWGPPGQSAARLSLWLDYGYLALYGAFWTLAVAAARDLALGRTWRRFAIAGGVVVAFPAAAATLDAIEDVGLLLALVRHGGETAPGLAAVCATGKFLFLFLAIGYVVACLARRGYERSARRTLGVLAALALALAALVINAVVTSGETRAADRSAPGRIVKLPGGDLHVIDQGPRRAEALVLLHGYACSTNWWEPAARVLDGDHRVIRVDLLGHGASEKPAEGYGMPDQARLVVGALRKLGVRRAIVVGHSMGAEVAVATAEQDRELVRGVMVIDMSPDDAYEEGPGELRLAFAPLIGQALHRLLPDSMIKSRLESEAFAGEVKLPDAFVQDFRRVTYTAFTRSAEGSREYRDARPLDQRMSATRRPLLVLFGARDRAVNPSSALRWDVPGATVTRWPGVGHSPQYERPAQTARLILRFADRVLGAPERRRAHGLSSPA